VNRKSRVRRVLDLTQGKPPFIREIGHKTVNGRKILTAAAIFVMSGLSLPNHAHSPTLLHSQRNWSTGASSWARLTGPAGYAGRRGRGWWKRKNMKDINLKKRQCLMLRVARCIEGEHIKTAYHSGIRQVKPSASVLPVPTMTILASALSLTRLAGRRPLHTGRNKWGGGLSISTSAKSITHTRRSVWRKE